jgi:hypothetical protein
MLRNENLLANICRPVFDAIRLPVAGRLVKQPTASAKTLARDKAADWLLAD